MNQVSLIAHNVPIYNLIHFPLQFCIPHCIANLLHHLEFISSQSSSPAASLVPWGTIPRGTKPPAACYLLARFPWTLATIQAITCDFASQSRCNIVPTLDDLTLVISVTLLCPLGRTPHALTSAQHACCAARCSIGATVSYAIAGGQGKSAPTLVTPLVGQQNPCISHSATTPSTHSIVRSSQ